MNFDDLEPRIQDVLDGVADENELAALQRVLAEEPEARRLYLECIYLEMAMDCAAMEAAHEIRPGDVIPMDRVLERQKRRSLRSSLMVAAAVIGIAVVTSIFIMLPEPPIASFAVSPNSQFTIVHASGSRTSDGDALAVGAQVRLDSGALELTFDSGVRGVVQAPAEFELRSKSAIDLSQGTAWFTVPEKAVGFQVDTPEFLLTDLGTEFGVISKPDSEDEVHVFTGRVRVHNHRGSGEEIELVANEASRTRGDGSWKEIALRSDSFLNQLPSENPLPPHLYWSFDEIENDRLRAAGTHSLAAEIELRRETAGQGPIPVSGRVGGALSFDEVGDGLLSNWSGISGDKPRSVAFWIKLPTESPDYDATIVHWGVVSHNLDKNNEWMVRLTNYDYTDPGKVRTKRVEATRLQLMFGTGSWFIGTTGLTKGKWHHVAVCYEGERDSRGKPKVQFYLDGRPDHADFIYRPGGLFNPVNTVTDGVDSVPMAVGRIKQRKANKSCNAVLDELYIFDGRISRSVVKKLSKP